MKISHQMQEYLENDAVEFNKTSSQHIVRRHRDILRDYSTEFSRSCSNISSQLQRLLTAKDIFNDKNETIQRRIDGDGERIIGQQPQQAD